MMVGCKRFFTIIHDHQVDCEKKCYQCHGVSVCVLTLIIPCPPWISFPCSCFFAETGFRVDPWFGLVDIDWHLPKIRIQKQWLLDDRSFVKFHEFMWVQGNWCHSPLKFHDFSTVTSGVSHLCPKNLVLWKVECSSEMAPYHSSVEVICWARDISILSRRRGGGGSLGGFECSNFSLVKIVIFFSKCQKQLTNWPGKT